MQIIETLIIQNKHRHALLIHHLISLANNKTNIAIDHTITNQYKSNHKK